jgi:hypothetical protein
MRTWQGQKGEGQNEVSPCSTQQIEASIDEIIQDQEPTQNVAVASRKEAFKSTIRNKHQHSELFDELIGELISRSK